MSLTDSLISILITLHYSSLCEARIEPECAAFLSLPRSARIVKLCQAKVSQISDRKSCHSYHHQAFSLLLGPLRLRCPPLGPPSLGTPSCIHRAKPEHRSADFSLRSLVLEADDCDGSISKTTGNVTLRCDVGRSACLTRRALDLIRSPRGLFKGA